MWSLSSENDRVMYKLSAAAAGLPALQQRHHQQQQQLMQLAR